MNTVSQESFDIVYMLLPTPDGGWLMARQSGLFRSDNHGQTWHPMFVTLGLDVPLAAVAAAVSPNYAADRTVIAGVYGGVMLSRDGGESWQGTLFPQPPSMTASILVSPDFAADGTIIAGTTEDGVYRSTDHGQTWQPANFGLLDRRVYCMALSPDGTQDQTILVGTETGLFRSINGGRSWHDFPLRHIPAPILSMTMLAEGDVIIGTESGGLLHISKSDSAWRTLLKTGESINAIYAMPPYLLALVGDQAQISHDNGISWQMVVGSEGATAVHAPEGLAAHQPLWAGYKDGSTKILQLG